MWGGRRILEETEWRWVNQILSRESGNLTKTWESENVGN